MLEYPFDSAMIMRKKKSLCSSLRQQPKPTSTRIAVLGGSTTNHVCDILELFLLDYGIDPVIYQCEYGQFYEEILYNNEALRDFAPDFIYLHTTNRNITRYPSIGESDEQVQQLLDEQYERFARLWHKVATDYGCTVIQNNFELPDYRLQGNRDAADLRGAVNFISRLNLRLADYAASHTGFFVHDINYLSARCGLSVWNDTTAWQMYKYSPSPAAIPELCHSLAAIIKSVLGKNRKALVLDLDNTLWGGVVGDDGVEGIELGNETPTGQVYLAFQNYLRELSAMGVMLTVNSKNDHDNAIAGLRHPSSRLAPEDFITIKANWDNKDSNILDIAHELNILPDSLVFVDDNPVERGIVSALEAGIAVPDIGQPEDYIRTLDRSGFFEVTNFSGDDLRRNEMYKENKERTRLETEAGSYEDYLRSLDMYAEIAPFAPVYIPRIAQLTGKSNQFNLTTLRCTVTDIEAAAADSGKITLYGKLADKFGDNGVVSIVMGNLEGETVDITLWLMSCRVLKRGMEDAMLDALVDTARAAGVGTLQGHYYPTPKNSMVRDFYTTMGFELVSRADDDTGLWRLQLEGYHNRNTTITIEDGCSNEHK